MTDAADTTTEPPVDADADVSSPAELYGCQVTDSRGQLVIHPSRESYLDVVRSLLADGYDMAIDLTAVDYLEYPERPLPSGVEPERFEVVTNLLDMTHRRRIRLRIQVPESDPSLPTLFDMFPGTEALEREVYDMFGIDFTDHPDMTRILMPEDWEGHPLRKDYDQGEIPVQFKGAHA